MNLHTPHLHRRLYYPFSIIQVDSIPLVDYHIPFIAVGHSHFVAGDQECRANSVSLRLHELQGRWPVKIDISGNGILPLLGIGAARAKEDVGGEKKFFHDADFNRF